MDGDSRLNDPLVTCSYKGCDSVGEYGLCYLSLESECRKYNEYMNMLGRRHDNSKLETSDE